MKCMYEFLKEYMGSLMTTVFCIISKVYLQNSLDADSYSVNMTSGLSGLASPGKFMRASLREP